MKDTDVKAGSFDYFIFETSKGTDANRLKKILQINWTCSCRIILTLN